ncbi:MAG: hypothetical protein JNL70_25580 [Saprospiraceae bacterium]|nr:hypothetical protein [Saprospiraceae bacterium]
MSQIIVPLILLAILLIYVLVKKYNKPYSNSAHSEGLDDGQVTELKCLRCFDTRMIYNGTERFHVGSNSAPFILGDFGELFVSKQTFDVYYCPSCGKAEFYYRKKKE